MEFEYFISDIGKIIIYRKNNIKIYYKEIDNKFYLLNNSEYEYIESILNNTNKHDYKSERLIKLIKNNRNIENPNDVESILANLETIIPKNCTNSLYNNIKSLKIKLNLNADLSKINLENIKNINFADYDYEDNIIKIYPECLKFLLSVKNQHHNPDKFFSMEIIKNLSHELIHMSSTRHDLFGNYYVGFDEVETDDENKKNRGLTEGMTEYLCEIICPYESYFITEYYLERLIVQQLILIVGKKVMFESYFLNKGITRISDALNSLHNDKELSYFLFRNVEDNFKIKSLNSTSNIISNIQKMLIFYFQNTLINIAKTGNFKLITEYLEMYEKSLITKELLVNIHKDPEMYPGLEESNNKFYELKEYMFGIINLYEGGISK